MTKMVRINPKCGHEIKEHEVVPVSLALLAIDRVQISTRSWIEELFRGLDPFAKLLVDGLTGLQAERRASAKRPEGAGRGGLLPWEQEGTEQHEWDMLMTWARNSSFQKILFTQPQLSLTPKQEPTHTTHPTLDDGDTTTSSISNNKEVS